ncbi:MAG: N-acetyltransferase [Candidatus Bathyarchaeia archaeon]
MVLTQYNYTIRKFNPSDLEAVIYINRTCLPENYSPSFFLEIYQNCPEGFLVAETENFLIIGYIMCRLEFGLSEFKRLKFVRKGHIVSIAVLPEFRRKGIAMELIDKVLKFLNEKKIDECFLEVRTTNEPAIGLYKKLGFSIVRTMPGYYMDGTDAYVMAIDLKNPRFNF